VKNYYAGSLIVLNAERRTKNNVKKEQRYEWLLDWKGGKDEDFPEYPVGFFC
jgi:hypothetical protein